MGASLWRTRVKSEGVSTRRLRDVDEVKCLDHARPIFLSVLYGACGGACRHRAYFRVAAAHAVAVAFRRRVHMVFSRLLHVAFACPAPAGRSGIRSPLLMGLHLGFQRVGNRRLDARDHRGTCGSCMEFALRTYVRRIRCRVAILAVLLVYSSV